MTGEGSFERMVKSLEGRERSFGVATVLLSCEGSLKENTETVIEKLLIMPWLCRLE